jgi:hypothetical protein
MPFPDEPAGSSVISRPGARTVDTSALPDDPFGSVNYGGDPFADVGTNDDPFSTASTSVIRPLPGTAVTAPRRSGMNPVVIVLLVVAVLGAVACIACVAIAASGTAIFGSQFGQAVQEMMLTVTALPELSTLQANQSLPGNVNNRGSLSYGQELQQTVDTFTDDSWTFTGRSGDQVTIEVNATDGDLDPQLVLYDPARKQIAENDDLSNSNHNSRLTITLPRTGTYTIIVSAFGSGGDYTLRLTQQ